MKKLLFMIISMAACLTMSGQQINQRLNDYRSRITGTVPLIISDDNQCRIICQDKAERKAGRVSIK